MRPEDRISLWMTEAVLSIGVDEPAGEVLRLFAGYPVHHLPVLRGRQVVGMLSSADVMKLELFLPKHDNAAHDYLNQRMTVAALMRRPAITILADQSVERAAELMARHAIHALPVVDAEQQLLGIVTTTDLIAAALRAAPTPGAAGDAAPAERTADSPPAGREILETVAAARAADAAGGDPGPTARALLHFHQRATELEHVLEAADRYLSAGQSQQLHTALLRVIAQAKRGGPTRSLSAPLTL
jgi:CBS-domain-containing membrane protein